MSTTPETPKPGPSNEEAFEELLRQIHHDVEAGKWNIFPLVALEVSLAEQIGIQEIKDKGQPLGKEDKDFLDRFMKKGPTKADWYSLDMFGPQSFCYAIVRAMAILEEQGMNCNLEKVPNPNQTTKKDVSYYLCDDSSVGMIQLAVGSGNPISSGISSTNLSSRRQTILFMYEDDVRVFIETGIETDPDSRVRKETRFSRLPYLLFYHDVDLNSAKDILAMTHFLVSLAPIAEIKAAREHLNKGLPGDELDDQIDIDNY